MGTLRSGALLAVLVILALAVKAAAVQSAEKPTSMHIFSNQTLLNATVHLKTCKGENVIQAPLQPPTILLKGINFSREFSCFPNFTCIVEYPLPGNYSLEVRWLNRVIYAGTVDLNASGSQIHINTRTAYVGFFVRTAERRDLRDQSVELYIEPYRLIARSGQIVLLPFGVIKYRVQFAWVQDIVLAVSGESTVGCDTGAIEVRLPLLSRLTFALQALGGVPATGINGSAELFFNGTRIASADLLRSNVIDLTYAPLGRYTIKVYLSGRLSSELYVDVTEKNNTYTVMLPVASIVKLKVLDARGEIVSDETLVAQLTDPLGRLFSERLTSGAIVLNSMPLGRYELEIFSEKLGRAIGRSSFEVQGSDSTIFREVSVSIARVRVSVQAEGSSTLPERSKVTVKSLGVLLLSRYLDSPRESVTGDLGYLPLGAIVQIEYSYDTFSYSVELSAGGGVLALRVPIYDVAVKFVDLDGQPVSGCTATLSSPYLNYAADLSGWMLEIKHVPLSDLLISVKCSNVEVARSKVSASELKTGNITVTVNVKALEITVKNLLGKPVSGAKVLVRVSSPSGVVNLTSTTGDDGVAVLYRVPLPPSSNISLHVSYRGFTYAGVLSPSEKSREVILDVLIDTPLLTLSATQALLAILGASVLAGTLIVVLRKYLHLKTLREMFASPFEEERESLIGRLKRILERKREEKEEEEISLFG
ncbi:MAG: carboxypeptidase-like regulatory domain-containing protein [Thermofilum sp.]